MAEEKRRKINELSQEERDKQELENLKQGHQHCKEIYDILLDRFKAADTKSNMLLVFNAAILTLLTIIFPLSVDSDIIKILIYIFLSLFCIDMFIALTLIIISLFPRGIPLTHYDNFIHKKFYKCTNIEYYDKMIDAYVNHNKEMKSIIQKKHRYNKPAMFCTMINIALMFIMIILSII